MNVSVVITSYNNSHNLTKCIESILRQKRDRLLGSLEVIIVDSGSTDNSANIVQRYGDIVRFIRPPRSTRKPVTAPVARNIGASYATGDILAFTDSDCAVDKQWIAKMLSHYLDGTVDAVIGNREPDIGEGFGTFIRRYEFVLYSNKFTIDKPLLMSNGSNLARNSFMLLATNNFSMRRALWLKIGGMKNIFPGEDIVLEVDILKEGGHILFDPDIVVSHNHPVSFRRLMRRAWENGIATYRIDRHSNGLINSRHFQERGRNFCPSSLIVSVSVLALFTLLSILLGRLSEYLQISMVLAATGIVLATLSSHVRLQKILAAKDAKTVRKYKINFVQMCAFVAAHFLIKLVATLAIVTAPYSDHG